MAQTVLYFAEVGPNWADWLQVVNVGNAPARITALARNAEGNAVWSQEKVVSPFCGWNPAMEDVKVMTWMQITSDQPIVAERHMHSGTQVIDLPGASVQNKGVGRRMAFPEVTSGAHDWFRFVNVSDADAHVSMVIRNSQGHVVRQLSQVVPPLRWWDVDEARMGQVSGAVEVTSTQPIVGERHLHYEGGKTAVGQLGQVLDD